MNIQRIANRHLEDVTKLVTKVFMEFEAPDYTDEGIKTFFDTALHNQEGVYGPTGYLGGIYKQKTDWYNCD